MAAHGAAGRVQDYSEVGSRDRAGIGCPLERVVHQSLGRGRLCANRSLHSGRGLWKRHRSMAVCPVAVGRLPAPGIAEAGIGKPVGCPACHRRGT
jgi:hypothetical protein